MKRDNRSNEISQVLQAKQERELLRRSWGGFFLRLFLLLAALFVISSFVLGITRVSGGSMYPSYKDGDVLLYYRLGQYSLGDVVIFRSAEQDSLVVKRLVASAGDEVDIDEQSGAVLINGEILEEEYVFSQTHAHAGMTFPVVVPPGHVFVLGDNRLESKDSREIGFVREENIVGRAVLLIRG